MPIGLTLDVNDNLNYDYSNDNLKSQKEQRMIKNQYISPQFQESSTDIIELLSKAISKKEIGKGTQSEGYIITLPNEKQYIVRETETISPLTRNKLSHEINVYRAIQEYPESSKYISKLLYADIPLVYHKNSNKNKAYFIFEYVPGSTLENLINTNKMIFPFTIIMEWVTHLSKAIDFLDRLNIIHRDIKPQNIYIDTKNNRPLLFDLETACIKGKDCLTYEFRGTREYSPPKALKLLNQKDFSNLQSYQHTKFSDYYSLIKILEKDFSRIVIPSEKQQLLNYAKLMEKELLKQEYFYSGKGGTKYKRKTRNIIRNRIRNKKSINTRKHKK